MKKVAIVLAGSGAGNSAMVDYLKTKIAHMEAEIEVIQADKMPESGRNPTVFQIDNYKIEDLPSIERYAPKKQHRGKHRTHKNKWR